MMIPRVAWMALATGGLVLAAKGFVMALTFVAKAI